MKDASSSILKKHIQYFIIAEITVIQTIRVGQLLRHNAGILIIAYTIAFAGLMY